MSVLAIVVALAVLVVVSYVVEMLRPVPRRPDRLAWAPDIPMRFLRVGGAEVRYIVTGSGPPLVLLHTLRTQLDIFASVIPALAQRFTVYAYDYPGHGWSDAPGAAYAPEDFYAWTAAFLDAIDVRQAVVAGISIGGVIALVLAARGNARIARVISINPYDSMPKGSVRQSSLTARLILTPSDVPILGATVMRLRSQFVFDRILAGGVASRNAVPKVLAKEIYRVSARKGQYQGFLSLLAHERLWHDARSEYPKIRIPVSLVYGEQDWAPVDQRECVRELIPGVTAITMANAGHFLSLDRPQELIALIQ